MSCVTRQSIDRRNASPVTRAIAARCPARAVAVMCGPAMPARTRSANSTGSCPASSGARRTARHSSGDVPSSPNFGLVARSVRLSTRAGCRIARCWAIIPPNEMPARWNASAPSSSARATTASASAANVTAPGRLGAAPYPGASQATTRVRSASAASCGSQEIRLPPSPCSSTSGGAPCPASRHANRGPLMSHGVVFTTTHRTLVIIIVNSIDSARYRWNDRSS